MAGVASYMAVMCALLTWVISASQEPLVTIEMIQALVEAEVAPLPLQSHKEPEDPCSDDVCAQGTSLSLLQRKAAAKAPFVPAAQAKVGNKQPIHASNMNENVSNMYVTHQSAGTGKELVDIPSIGYAKVHKTGSSTVKHIIEHLMTERGRRLMIPVDHVHLGWPKTFPGVDNRAAMGLPDHQYDAIVDHTIFNAERFKSYLTSNPLLVGSLREPMAQAKSAYNYWRIEVPSRQLQTGKVSEIHIPTWEEHLDDLESHCSDPVEREDFTARFCNPQSYDLGWYEHVGLTTKYDNNLTMIKQWIESLESQLDNIILTEAIDEGLVLLRESLNVNINELSYLSLRESGPATEKSQVLVDPPQDRNFQKRLRDMYHVDLVLYDHFNKSFWNQWDSRDVQDRNDQLSALKKSNSDLDASGSYCKENCIRCETGVNLLQTVETKQIDCDGCDKFWTQRLFPYGCKPENLVIGKLDSP